jgi:hypothetical protein
MRDLDLIHLREAHGDVWDGLRRVVLDEQALGLELLHDPASEAKVLVDEVLAHGVDRRSGRLLAQTLQQLLRRWHNAHSRLRG